MFINKARITPLKIDTCLTQTAQWVRRHCNGGDGPASGRLSRPDSEPIRRKFSKNGSEAARVV